MSNTYSEPRYFIFIEKSENAEEEYTYRVIDVLIPGYMADGACNVKIAKCLAMIFPDAVTNYKIVDDEIMLEWTEEAIAQIEKLLKNLPSIYEIVGKDLGRMCRPAEELKDKSLVDAFDKWSLPENTPGIGKPGFHWGM